MKILHVGDIHLGCTLDNLRRKDEILAVFQHLVSMVRQDGIRAVLLAGDVFDSGAPSNESQTAYYDFLVNLQQAGCRQVIIIAGNHDNPNFLDAPQILLKCMNIHVLGNVFPDDLSREVIALGTPEAPEAYVCAVPYLRPRDVRKCCPEGENGADELHALHQGIEEHYRQVFALADRMRGGKAIPIIGMGHLYAAGSSFGSRPGETVGNLDPVDLTQCAAGFDYMALGHLHKPQCVAGHPDWRYAGSILPMDLRENAYAPQVILLDTADMSHPEVRELPAACFHPMCVVKGSMEELQTRLRELAEQKNSIWVKPVYTGETVLPNWAIDLRQEFRDTAVGIVLPEIQRQGKKTPVPPDAEPEHASLTDLTPEEIFLEHLDRSGKVTDPGQRETLLALYRSSQAKVYDPAQQKEKPGAAAGCGIMQFKRLFIKNVNSLYGENRIDFEAPEFKNGIFLIAGKTGAGKSSILDAILLALYGCTPRIRTISNTRDSVMSKGASEMTAELVFSLGEDEYRAVFRHSRTREHSRHPFRQPEHRLYKNGQECPPVPRYGIVPEIMKLIGMDSGQFCRCVLLAQGSFDAFLKSGPGERSEILKNITGIDVYTRIGTQIRADFQSVNEAKLLADKALEDIHFLSEEERAAAGTHKTAALHQMEELSAELKQRGEHESLFQRIEQARLALQSAQETAEAAQKALKEAEPLQTELADALRARNCENTYREYQHLRRTDEELKKSDAGLQTRQKTLKEQQETARNHAEKQRQLFLFAGQRRTAESALFREIRALDASLAEQGKQLKQAQQELAEAKQRRIQAETGYQQAVKQWEACRKCSETAEKYISDHAADKALAPKQEPWELRRKQLVALENANAAEAKALETLAASVRQAEEELARLQKKRLKTEQESKTQSGKIAEEQQKKDCLLEGKTIQDIRMAWAAAGKLHEFFQGTVQRQEYLEPGKPCPLCGSPDHPYCQGTPVPDGDHFARTAHTLAERLSAIEQSQTTLRTMEQARHELEIRLAAEEEKIQAQNRHIQEKCQLQKARRTAWESSVKTAAETAAALQSEFRQTLQTEWLDHAALPEELARRIRAFSEAQKNMEALAAGQRLFDAAHSVYQTVAPQNEQAVQQQTLRLETLAAAKQNSEQIRQEKFGGKTVADEEKRSAETFEQCRKSCEAAVLAAVKADEAVRHHQEMQTQVRQKRILLQPELVSARNRLAELMRQSGLESEEDYLGKFREAPRIQFLSEKLQKLRDRQNIGNAALTERRKILKELAAALPDGVDREQNKQRIQELQTLKTAAQEQLTDAELKLKKDAEARTLHEAARKKAEELNLLCNQWTVLDNLLGSTPASDRFGRIAQGYTFRELLHFANANRLKPLQEHFTLAADAEDPLELNVIDHYRGDQVRTSRNLSGGECFEVSLALALGLADMSAVSQHARLGNVLLDEGFGTLDDNALESALELLMQLRQSDGKLVGIISHVTRLQERIETQIRVLNSGGMGYLSGAGVGHGTASEKNN